MNRYNKALYQNFEELLRTFKLVKPPSHPFRTGKGNIAFIVLSDPDFKAGPAGHLPVSFP
jgi:hypothetical protein